jgi:hypothetical protein
VMDDCGNTFCTIVSIGSAANNLGLGLFIHNTERYYYEW